MGVTTKLNIDTIKERFVLIHGNKYDYSLVNYKNQLTKVKIICPIHGEFEQLPKNHLKGCDCPKCGFINQCDKRRKDNDKFICEVNSIHNNIYNYSQCNYKNAHIKVKIICSIHGEFEQTPKAHLTLKQGCPECYNENRKYNAPSWNKDSWVDTGTNSNHFDGFKLYKIRCYNDTESFIKIGRTFNRLKIRFSEIPYQYEVLKVIESNDGSYIFDLEKRIKQIYSSKRYIPKISFGGMYECFDLF